MSLCEFEHLLAHVYSARLFVSAISSFVPVILSFMVREYGIDRKVSAFAAFGLSFSSLFQIQACLYIIDEAVFETATM